MRSRSILGCDQMGIETLVSMLNSGESDSDKEDIQQPTQPTQQQIAQAITKLSPTSPQPLVKNDAPRINRTANMLRKTGMKINSHKF